MIPEISVTCGGRKIFINSITVKQYKRYIALMEKNVSDKITDAMFFNKKIIQETFGNRMPLEKLGGVDAVEFLTAAKGIHFIMQSIISQKLLDVVPAERVEREASAFDEYDLENGYEEERLEQNAWTIYGEIIDRVVKIAIRLLKNSYSQCMREDIVALLEYLKFELDAIEENQA